jgi:GNAT superfamily N-acetyltransferase
MPSLSHNGEVHVLDLDSQDRICAVLVLQLRSRAMFIESIAVYPDHQRHGLGRRLMAFAEQQARVAGVDEMHLYTNEAMRENIAVYQHLGYEEVEHRVDEGFRRVFMRKRRIPCVAEFPPVCSGDPPETLLRSSDAPVQ